MVNPTRRQIQLALKCMAPDGHPMRDVVIKEPVKRGKMKQPERELQEAVCRYLDMQPRILYWANNPQIITGKMTPQKMGYLASLKKRGFKKGVPDLMCLFRSKHGSAVFLALELKAAKGVVSDEQQGFMEACNERGGFTAVVRSLEDVQEALRVAGY